MNRYAVRIVAVVSALVLAPIAAPGAAAATHPWRIVDLGLGDYSQANAINDRGHVVGRYDGGAFLWRNGRVTNLGPGEALDINNRDEVVGYSTYGVGFLWRNGVFTSLPGTACAINDRGEVVGTSDSGAFVWRDGVTTYLDSLPGTSGSDVKDINNAGVIVGNGSEGAPLSDFIVRWLDGKVEALSTTERGFATAINRHGSVTGIHSGSWGNHGFLWQRGEFIAIAPPPGTDTIQPWGINDRTQIVGVTGIGAFVWQDGRITLLPRLVAGSGATDINNRGQIVGSSGARSDGLNEHAVLWTR